MDGAEAGNAGSNYQNLSRGNLAVSIRSTFFQRIIVPFQQPVDEMLARFFFPAGLRDSQ